MELKIYIFLCQSNCDFKIIGETESCYKIFSHLTLFALLNKPHMLVRYVLQYGNWFELV